MRGSFYRHGFLIVLLLFLGPLSSQGASREGGVGREGLGEGWVLEREEIERILETYLQKIVNDPKKSLQIKDLRCDATVLLPPGALSHEVIAPEQAYRGGSLSATVVFLINGQEKKRIRISARVDLYADVLVASRFLQRHHELEEKDVQWVNRNVAILPNDIVTEMGDVLGRRTTLSINGQEVFRKGMVEFPPVIKRGDRVIMTIENRQFKITTWGETKDEGRRGDRIRLVNLSSKKEVFGRVLDANTVLVDY
jgi:flagellar basal body P-ring formation protein FlgA